MNSETDTQPMPRRGRSWFSFSLRTLLMLTALVAAFFGGRASTQLRRPLVSQLQGAWEMHLPAGFVKPVTIKPIDDDLVIVSAGGVLSGTYRWRNQQLVVVDPSDDRMTGLTWRWDGKEFVLIGEPPNSPTGSSYLGARLMARPSDLKP